MDDGSTVKIRSINAQDKHAIQEEMRKWWGSDMIVLRGEKVFPAEFGGFIAEYKQQIAGMIVLRVRGDTCEILSLTTNTTLPSTGIKLVEATIRYAQANSADRIAVVTTNDNINALKFYQQSGFTICDWRKNAIKKFRQIKPRIPLKGNYHIPIRDEIELELSI